MKISRSTVCRIKSLYCFNFVMHSDICWRNVHSDFNHRASFVINLTLWKAMKWKGRGNYFRSLKAEVQTSWIWKQDWLVYWSFSFHKNLSVKKWKHSMLYWKCMKLILFWHLYEEGNASWDTGLTSFIQLNCMYII